jgi:hypothetical protein
MAIDSFSLLFSAGFEVNPNKPSTKAITASMLCRDIFSRVSLPFFAGFGET